MKSNLRGFVLDLKLPYLRALLLIALIPLFPEYISFFLAIAAFVFAWKDIKQQNKKLHLGTVGKLLLAYCSYMTITCLFSTYKLQCTAVAAMWWFFFLVYLVVANLLTDEDRIDAFLMCITGAAGIVGLIACVQYRLNFFTDNNFGSIWSWLDEIVFEYVPFNMTITSYQLRAYSTFPNPNMLAQYLVMVAPFVACFNFIERRPELRLFSRISLFLTFAGILFSFSRGGYIALLVLLIALIVINIRRRFAAVTLYVVSALLFLPEEVMTRLFSVHTGITSSSKLAETVIGSVDNSASVNNTPIVDTPIVNVPATGTTAPSGSEIITQVGTDAAINERFKIWVESIGRILERPFFGYGVGTEPTANMMEQIGINAPHAHNIILQLLLEGGIFALLLMTLIGFQTLRNGFKLLRNKQNQSFWMGFAVLGFAVGFVLHGMVDYPLTTPRLICCFLTILGIVEQSVQIYVNALQNKQITR